MEHESLDNILNGTSAPEAQAPTEPQPETAIAEIEALPPKDPERPRDEHGRFLPMGEKEPEPAVEAAPEPSASPAPVDEPPVLEHPALIGERRRRQTAEAENEKLRQQLAQLTQPPQQLQPQAKPDQWEDPEGHDQWVAEQAGTIAEQKAVQAVQQHLVRVSAEAAKVKYPDYLEKVPIFEQLAQASPGLWGQMFQHPNPAEFAYTVAKQHEQVSQYGSLEGYLAAEKAKWEAEALEKLKATLPASTAPPTLSNERNVGSRSGPEWSGPKPLSELLQ